MAPVNKNNLLNYLEERVENHLQAALKIFQNEPVTVLLRPADNGGWSIAQCLEHLNGYGVYYLPQINSGLHKHSGKPLTHTFQSTWLGAYFTRMMEPSTGTKKYKAFKNHIPAADLNAHAVVAEFIRQQEELLTYLKLAHQVNLNVKIPISISKFVRLKMGDVLQFVIAHNERHLLQAKRNLPVSVFSAHEKLIAGQQE